MERPSVCSTLLGSCDEGLSWRGRCEQTGALLLEFPNLKFGLQLKGTQSASQRVIVAVTCALFAQPPTCSTSGHTRVGGYAFRISKQRSPPLSRTGKRCFPMFHQCYLPFLLLLLTDFLGKVDGISGGGLRNEVRF